MTDLVFHIGYHKTATSWMQIRLFTPSHGFHQIGTHDDAFQHIVRPSVFEFDADAARMLLQERQAQTPAGHVPVLSSEILSGHPFYGGRESDLYARRLHAIAPDAKILISIRNQMKVLPSVYMQYIRRGGTMPYQRFFREEDDLGFFGFRAAHFAYDHLIGLYQSLFGAERVVVVTQESLQKDLAGTSADLAARLGAGAFAGLDPVALEPFAPSYPEYALPLLRRINHVQTSVINPTPIMALGTTPDGMDSWVGALTRRKPLVTWFGAKRPVSDYVKRQFDGVYTASNARLAQMLGDGVDLTGYP